MTTKEATDLVGILLLIIFVLLCVIHTLYREIQDRGQENKQLEERIDTLQGYRATQARQLDRYKGRYG